MSSRLVLLAALALCAPPVCGANWTVSRINHAALPAPTSGTVLETSGVAYLGPIGEAHRFIAAQQNHGNIVRFDITLTATGAIASIANVVNIPIHEALDFEGIAYTSADRDSVFLSEEDSPGVREVSLSTGLTLQTVNIPPVFSKRRVNRGFESLTRSLDDTVMWTANEEALTVDGELATAAAGTAVRLVKLDVSGNVVTAGAQYVYVVEPIHAAANANRNGLNDLTAMPDGTLLALERSAAVAFPAFLNRIFEIDFDGATDVSAGPTATGLIGNPYSPVGKQLLWSGAADGALGQNLEGLTLGPRLANGGWVLLGVVDDAPGDADTLSANTVVAFVATPNVTGDFDGDGDADGNDFLAWQRGLGRTIGARRSEGDGDRDGDVDADDLQIWKSATEAPPSRAAPEPSSALQLAPGLMALRAVRRPRRGAEPSG